MLDLKCDEALVTFSRVSAEEPGNALARETDLDAEAFLSKEVSLSPSLVEAYYDLGRAQWFGGNQSGAKATWGKGATANGFAPWSVRCRELLESVERGGTVPRALASA